MYAIIIAYEKKSIMKGYPRIPILSERISFNFMINKLYSHFSFYLLEQENGTLLIMGYIII